MYQGTCLCGAIKFTISTKIKPGEICHCQQCRQWTGHQYASTEVPRKSLSIENKQSLKWYQSSEKVRRGFCSHCGSSIFFDPLDQDKHDWIGIALGCFTTPTGIQIEKHIFTAEKGDYYEIDDGFTQHDY